MKTRITSKPFPLTSESSRAGADSSKFWQLGVLSVLITLTQACGGGGSGAIPTLSNELPIGGGGNPPTLSLKILFIGDEFTSANNMPMMLESLATAATLEISSATQFPGGIVSPGGDPLGALTIHTMNAPSLDLIDSDDWDFVVLQEESTFPTLPFEKSNVVTPAVNLLDTLIQNNNPATSVIMFQTWGHEQGGQFCSAQGCSPNFVDFDAMQDSLTTSYDELALSIGADVAPVGEAWRLARTTLPSISLHDLSGIAPSIEGSYLAACVLYATIYGRSPRGLPFTAGLPTATAESLQQIASNSVFGPTCGFTIYGTDTVPINTLSLTPSGDPSLGGEVMLTPGGQQPFDPGAFIFSSFSDAFLALNNGVLLIDLTQELVNRRFVPNGSAWTFTIPPDPQFTGLDLFFQVISDGPTIVGDPFFSPAVKLQICP
ncbi:MAG: hypothetical protein ACI8TQ_003975 [Planctomycetota bacterium]|jgi:hypothetical protein